MNRALCLFVILWANAWSPAGAQTLWQTWRMAVARDPQFRVDRMRFEALSEQKPSTLAALLPQISVNAGLESASGQIVAPQLSGNGLSTYLYSEDSHSRSASWNVVLSQVLFNWGALQAYRGSEYEVMAAAAQYQAAVQGLAVRVVTDYMRWVVARADVVTLEGAKRGFVREANVAQSQYRAGTTGVVGSEEATVALDQIRAQIMQAQSRLVGAQVTLEAVTGHKQRADAPFLPAQFVPPETHSVASWLSLAQQHSPALAAYRAMRRATSRNISAALGGFLPVVILQVEHQQDRQSGAARYLINTQDFSGPHSYRNLGNSVSLQFSWNLFAGGADSAALGASEYRQGEARAKLAVERRAIRQEIRVNVAAMMSAIHRIQLYRHARQVARRVVVTSSEGVRAGLVSENNAIVDRKSAATVERSLNASISSAVIHYAKLADAAGVITPLFVRRLSRVLQATGRAVHG